DGRGRGRGSSRECGRGTKTVLCQMVGETLGLPYETVEIAQADTGEVPNSGPTVASRTVMVVGKLVQSAAEGIRQTLFSAGLLAEHYSEEEVREACKSYVSDRSQVISLARHQDA